MPSTPAHDRDPSNWQSSPVNGVHQVFLQQLSPFAPAPPQNSHQSPSQYSSSPVYPEDLQTQEQYSPSSQHSSSMDRFSHARDRHRFTPYPASSAMPPPRRLSTPSRGSLSLEIPPMPIHDGQRTTPSSARAHDPIQLPAIQPPAKGDAQSIYALPPISALEDLRGIDTQDSAAVLRRLQLGDDSAYSEPDQSDAQQLKTQRSLSAPAPKYVIISLPRLFNHDLIPAVDFPRTLEQDLVHSHYTAVP
jgi:hypothetical protein